MRMTLQLFMNVGEIGGGLDVLVEAPHAGAEQGLFQAALIPAFCQRPTDADGLSPFQILVNRTLTDRTTAGNLALAEP